MAKALGVEKGGRLSSSLEQLEEAGFVSSDPGLNPFTGEAVQQKRYRICDNYARFYLRYVERLRRLARSSSLLSLLGVLESWRRQAPALRNSGTPYSGSNTCGSFGAAWISHEATKTTKDVQQARMQGTEEHKASAEHKITLLPLG